MYNKSENISASEINKFVYCPYQWYYERFYGQKKILEILKSKKEKKIKRQNYNLSENKFVKGKSSIIYYFGGWDFIVFVFLGYKFCYFFESDFIDKIFFGEKNKKN